MGLSFHLPDRVVDAALEAALLFFLADGQEVFEQDDAAFDDCRLEAGCEFEEAPGLLLAGEAHHPVDAGPVVPAAIEDHDLAGRRQIGNVALHVDLRFLAIGRGGQGRRRGIRAD